MFAPTNSLVSSSVPDCYAPTQVPFNFDNCGVPWSMYTNFFVADIHRFMQPDVQSFLNTIDDSGEIYLRRWGDLSIQSVAVQVRVRHIQPDCPRRATLVACVAVRTTPLNSVGGGADP